MARLSGVPGGALLAEGLPGEVELAEDVKKTILFCHAAARSTLISRRQLAIQLGGDDIKGLCRTDAGNGPGFTESAVGLGYR